MEDEIDLKIFSERFTSLIKEKQTDITFLAKQLGLKSNSTIYRYMNGEMRPKITTIKCLADFYHVNPRWLMGYNVSRESALPYGAIFDFSTETDRSMLESAIVYAIQNDLKKDEISNDTNIKYYINKLETLDKNQALAVIQNISVKFRGHVDFSLDEYIASLQYKSEEPKIEDIYMHLAKEAQNLKLDEDDVNAILNLYKKYKK